MKRKIALTIGGLALCASMIMFNVNSSIGQVIDDGEAKCSSGSTGICFIITVNGNTTAKCKSTEGDIKDCK